MRKLLILMLLVPCVAAAQTGTDTIKLPVRVAKEIAVELNQCDSIIDMLISIDAELAYTQQVSRQKDTLLANAYSNLMNASRQINNEREQKTAYKTAYADVKKSYDGLQVKYKKHKALRNFIDILAGAAAAIVIYVLAK